MDAILFLHIGQNTINHEIWEILQTGFYWYTTCGNLEYMLIGPFDSYIEVYNCQSHDELQKLANCIGVKVCRFSNEQMAVPNSSLGEMLLDQGLIIIDQANPEV